MINNDNFLVAKPGANYECKKCDYKTCKKFNFDKHLHTKRHTMINNDNKNVADSSKHFSCVCGKLYTQKSNLCRHKKSCNKAQSNVDEMVEQMSDKDLIMYLLKENKEFKELILDQSNKMMEQNNKMFELANKPTIGNVNNNCNNKQQFNLQVFLNEKCKDAMNMSDFISSLKIQDEDFENIGKLGYVQGISNIFIKGLKDLDETMRPMHCNDLKRETLYIKDNDVWGKDDNKHKIRNAIALIAHKNFKYIPVWIEANPQALDGTTNKNDQYMRIANQITTAITPDDDLGINKIIRNVASSVIIDKGVAL